MRILLLTDEVWNDRVHGNNVLSNWFDGFPAEFAQIYCSPGNPLNNCCHRYFQITDKMMIRSILFGKKAGRCVTEMETESGTYNSTDIGHIGFLRKHLGNFLRLCKNIVWALGRYNLEQMERFISDFSPDIIFTPRMATPKLLRLERIVKQYANCPMVAFTGDNEYSLRIFSFSPIAWINRFWTRSALKNNSSLYSLYYTLSEDQMSEYKRKFSCPIKILRKCKPSTDIIHPSVDHKPIRFIYAGKLYCNRWKTLSAIAQAIDRINTTDHRIILDIYTKDKLTKHQLRALRYPNSVYIHGAISQSEVMNQYSNSDVALHIESFDLKYRLATRLSFSTKIIDCLGGGCAVMVVAWKNHTGYKYLKNEEAAICVSRISDIFSEIEQIAHFPEILQHYKNKAINTINKNHERKKVQNMLINDFNAVILGKKSINIYVNGERC